ncbi:MAG: energy-coupled thiamine transporter ThiT [Lachnospiraceae bacterium]|nr:energy-coupled thiamine transporter ThiT [Lachnospiraceae bacterium]
MLKFLTDLSLFYEDEGYYYPTTKGTVTIYGIAALAIIIAFVLIFIAVKKRAVAGSAGAAAAGAAAPAKSNPVFSSTKQMVICALLLALGFVTSMFGPKMPWGGRVTLFSMLFISYIGYLYGLKVGIFTALTYSILQFMQDPYVLTPLQVCLDYFFAFTALGLSGLFANMKKNGLLIGYIVAVLGRFFFATLAGYIYWSDPAYIPESFPKALTFLYSPLYNLAYIGPEMAVTIAILCIPAVKKVLEDRLKKASLD